MAKSKSSASAGRLTVAVVQAASVAFDRKRTLEKAVDLTRDAARRGAKLVLFPEAFVSGYPRGLISAPWWARAVTKAEKIFGATLKARSTCPVLSSIGSAKPRARIPSIS